MGVNIPSSAEIAQAMRAKLEAIILQTVPLLPKAFMRVWSVTAAMLYKTLYLFGVERAKQCFTRTQTGQDLLDEGAEWGVVYKYETATVLQLNVVASGGATIGVDNSFVGDDNGMKYNPDAAASEVGGIIDISVTAEEAGALGNLEVGDALTITEEVAGASRFATVISIITTGTDDEDEEVYRERVLFEKRTAGGGGNAADYKRWSEEVEGIIRAYPYAGNPLGPASSVPGERTVFCEAQTAIDPDGIPTALLLAEVRTSITTDPETGLARQPLGMTDETLYVEPITRPAYNVVVYGLNVEASDLVDAKAQMSTDLNNYFRSLRPYVDGVDSPTDRNDTITVATISETASGVAKKYGGSIQSLTFDQGSGALTEEMLDQGETAKLGILSYV